MIVQKIKMSIKNVYETELTAAGRKYCLSAIHKYDGKLGSLFLKMLTLSMEKRALMDLPGSDFNSEALLLGIYFHDVGRVDSDEEDHVEYSWKHFQQFSLEKTKSSEVVKIVQDCCLHHGSDKNPSTPEGKYVQYWDKAIVIMPEVMLAFITQQVNKGMSYNDALQLLNKKLMKWSAKISPTYDELEHTIGLLKKL